jgi:hypothetical protein
MERVDAEAEAHHEPLYTFDPGHGAEAAHVLLRRAQPRLVTPQQDVRTAVDEHDRVDGEMCDESFVGCTQRTHTRPRKRVHRGRTIRRRKPARQHPLRKVVHTSPAVRADHRDVRSEPVLHRAQVGEREVRKVNLLAQAGQRQRKRQTGVHVEAATGAGDQDSAGVP